MAVLTLLQLMSPAHAGYRWASEVHEISQFSGYIFGPGPSDADRQRIAAMSHPLVAKEIVKYLDEHHGFGREFYISESMLALLWMQAEDFIDAVDLYRFFRMELRRPYYGNYRYQTKYIPDERNNDNRDRHPSWKLIRGLRHVRIDSPTLREKVKWAAKDAKALDYVLKAIPGLAIQIGFDMVGREFEVVEDIPHLREPLHLRILSILRDFKAAPSALKLNHLEWALRYTRKLNIQDEALTELASEWADPRNLDWKIRTLRPFLAKEVAQAAGALTSAAISTPVTPVTPRPKVQPEVIEASIKSYIGRERTDWTLELNALIAQHELQSPSTRGRKLRYTASSLKERIQALDKRIQTQKGVLARETRDWNELQNKLDLAATLREREQLLTLRKTAKASLQEAESALENLKTQMESIQSELAYLNGAPGVRIEKLTEAETQALQLTEVTDSQTPQERAQELGQRMRALLREREPNFKELLSTLLALSLDRDSKVMAPVFLKQFEGELSPEELKGWTTGAKMRALTGAVVNRSKRLNSSACREALKP